jgi:hypothetical protein
MYALDSTHGLRASAHTADRAVGIRGQHLTDCRRDGGIDWLIVTPTGRKLSGFIKRCCVADGGCARIHRRGACTPTAGLTG